MKTKITIGEKYRPAMEIKTQEEADDQNLERIKHAFPDYWKAYAKFCQPENDEPTT